MATSTTDPIVGQKRAAPGRPPGTTKKQKVEPPPTAAAETPPTANSPAPEKRKLPIKISDNAPLPTLPEPQSAALSDAEYQSIAASNVLSASLERSRTKWAQDGVFERYWINPRGPGYTGKNAKPLPPNNPDVKLQKSKGRCRLRIEPHIIEVDVYVEEREKPKLVKQYQQQGYGQQSMYYQSVRTQQQQQRIGSQLDGADTPYYQPNRTLPPVQHSRPPANQQNQPVNPTLPPNSQFGTPNRASPLPPQQSQPPARQTPASLSSDKKPSPDPVISMLASRASSDPELKGLMKEVATGSATPEQLTVFQRHIDELTAVIAKKKAAEEAETAAAEAKAAATAAAAQQQQQQNQQQQEAGMIQYDGANDSKPLQHALQNQPGAQPPHPYPYQQPPPPVYQTPVPQGPNPILLQFLLNPIPPGTPTPIDDRFLFPRHSILETLSPQHTLVSFLVTRTGREAVDPTGLNPETIYWQPVTMMVEVPYGREEIMRLVREWVAPVGEAQEHMKKVMAEGERAPEASLALRLPWKGGASTVVSEVATPEVGTPGVEEKVNKAKKTLPSALKKRASAGGGGEKKEGKKVEMANEKDRDAVMKDADGKDGEKADVEEVKPAVSLSGRPQRSVRKSVRISEG